MTFGWDSFGNPQGSLRIETTWEDAPLGAGLIARSPCYNLGGGVHTFRGDVYPDLSAAACRLFVLRYFAPDCEGNEAYTGIGTSINGSWQTLEVPFNFNVAFPTERSFRMALVMNLDPAAVLRSCYFDNVSLVVQGGALVEVPTPGPAGIALLALALVAAAMLTLRRVGGAPGSG